MLQAPNTVKLQQTNYMPLDVGDRLQDAHASVSRSRVVLFGIKTHTLCQQCRKRTQLILFKVEDLGVRDSGATSRVKTSSEDPGACHNADASRYLNKYPHSSAHMAARLA